MVVIGDMPGNTDEDVRMAWQNYPHYGRDNTSYWKTHFPNVEIAEKLITKYFAPKHIPVHTMYLTDSAEAQFKRMASLSIDKNGDLGKSDFLDVGADGAAERLTEIISKHVLKNIGGDRLLKAYDAKYGFHS